MKFLKASLLLCSLFAGALISAQASADTVVAAKVRFGSSSYSADWYLPSNTPKGLVYLQHGFQRNKGHLRALGNSLMAQGLMVLSVNASMTGGAASLAPPS